MEISKLNMLKYANGNSPKTKEEKEEIISKASKSFGQVLTDLGYSWETDPNMSDTPQRYIKALVNDLCKGNFEDKPKITAFDNVDKYDGMVAQCNIKLISLCSHHLLNFSGKAHVAYIPSTTGKVIGLSKLNRIVDHYARRPQVQENLTMQIHKMIDEVCEGNLGVAVLIEANHTCCSNRGIGHDSTMKTAKMSGAFLDNNDKSRDEFYRFIADLK